MEVARDFIVFNKAWDHISKWEGGFVNDQYDRGGATKFGISKRQYPDVDIEHLTEEEAKNIAHRDYWNVLRCGYIRSEEIAIELFDFGFNAGTHRSATILQRALLLMNYPVRIDGKVGTRTIAAVNRATENYERALLNALRGYEWLHYKNIVLRNPSQSRFIRGWLARI